LTTEQRKRFLAQLSEEELEFLRWDWRFWGRAEQQLPPGDWFLWLILTGRGWGKTRTAVEVISEMLRGPTPGIAPPGAPKLLSIIADSPFDLREYSIEGPSGFLNVGPQAWRPLYEPSKKTLTWPNGVKALLFSSEDPESLRGASGDFFWWDELAKSRYASVGWENLMFGMREGNPRGIVTTTPLPIPLIKKLVADPSSHVTRGSTHDNKDNLSPKFFKEVVAPRIGTRLGRQEIDGEIVDDVPGALWTREMFDKHRVRDVPEMVRVVVAIDPSGGGDDIGIVVAGVGVDGRGYVVEDRTCNLSPNGWGRRAVDAYRFYGADRIIAERNFGGAMVESTIRTVDANVSYKEVVASRGKVARAEPVAALYEQGRVSHIGGKLSALEDQCCLMGPTGYAGEGSPDRVDALVWALTELLLGEDNAEDWVPVQRGSRVDWVHKSQAEDDTGGFLKW
jgi:phage terminase large subunit-like protein